VGMNSSRLSKTWTLIRSGLEVLATLAIVAACGSLLWDRVHASPAGRPPAPTRGERVAPLPLTPVSISGAALNGNGGAHVAMIEYSDFQCPFCRRFVSDTLPSLRREYIDSGRVLLAFQNEPLEQLHKNALRAAQAAECALQAGIFWPFHDRLFAESGGLDDDSLRQDASAVGIQPTQFEPCFASEATAARVKAAETAGHEVGVSSTPTFLIGVRQSDGSVKVLKRIAGAVPLSEFQAAINDVLAVSLESATGKSK
jgi:protein-disulfide isomerase